MSRYSYFDAYPPYVPVTEKRARNRKAIDKLRKKDQTVQPVLVEGRTIARTWWGKSWNSNLERYADYGNRIERGRSYVCHGAVLDLQIEAGAVHALVQGSRSKPYSVTVTIKKLAPKVWDGLREESTRQLDSLTDLLAGKFPKALQEVFFAKGTGLFPAPAEISFDCSCPDWASMCKHVAAVLYGVGNRLDRAPELLFTLRQVTVEELLAQTVDATAKHLVGKAGQADGEDVLADADVSTMFGIEMDDVDLNDLKLPPPPMVAEPGPASLPAQKRAKQGGKTTKRMDRVGTSDVPHGRGKAKTKKKQPRPANSAPVKAAGKHVRRESASPAPQRGRMVELLLDVFGRSRKGLRAADLHVKLPRWRLLQVTNTLHRAVQAGLVERIGQGVYRRK